MKKEIDNLTVARKIASTIRSRSRSVKIGKKMVKLTVPPIKSVQVEQDGNMTIAIVNGKHIGWSKFNPNDTTTWTETTRRKKTAVRTKSRYSNFAGTQKAIYRAIEKALIL